jgi:hypothetical protein
MSDAVAGPAQPKEFFEKDYVTGERPKPPPPTPTRAGKVNMPSTDAPQVIPQNGVNPIASDVAAMQQALLQQGNGRKAHATLYVNSLDKAHFESVMRKVVSFAERDSKMRVTQVFHIGDYRNVSQAIKDDMARNKIFLGAMPVVPPHLQATDSPTWVINDKSGTHIVEGILDIDKCIDKDGQYRQPEPSMFQPEPQPTMGMQGF